MPVSLSWPSGLGRIADLDETPSWRIATGDLPAPMRKILTDSVAHGNGCVVHLGASAPFHRAELVVPEVRVEQADGPAALRAVPDVGVVGVAAVAQISDR